MGIFTTVTPTSPLKSSFAGFPKDMDDWSCSQWIAYWNRNKAGLGVAKAREIFLIDMDNIGSFADVNTCKYDCGFVNFFKKEGFQDVGNIISNAYCAADSAVNTVSDAVTSVSDTVGNVGDTLAMLTKPKVLIAAAILGGIVWYNYKTSKGKKNGFKRK